MPDEYPPTAREVAARSLGRSGLECPKCGCRHLDADGRKVLPAGTLRRYRNCRNCGAGFVTTQAPEKIVREVEREEDEEPERVRLYA